MPKFNWRKLLTELGRTLLPVVVNHVLPMVAEKLESAMQGTATGEDDPKKVIYGRRSTDTFEEAEYISREISTPVQR